MWCFLPRMQLTQEKKGGGGGGIKKSSSHEYKISNDKKKLESANSPDKQLFT